MNVPRRQRGFLAIVIAIVLVVFAAMAAAMVIMVTSGTRGAADHAQSNGALFLAESGIEWSAKQMFGSSDPQADCNALAGSGPFAMPNGQFSITASSYNSADNTCDVTSRGFVGNTIRTISGTIPESIINGGGGGAFDDSDEKFNNCGSANLECQDGQLIFKRPSGGGPGGGNTNTKAKASDLITDDWNTGDTVYFTANIAWDADPTGNLFEIKMKIQGQPDITCGVAMPSLNSGCAAPSSNPLYDIYDIVLVLGNTYDETEVQDVSLSASWGGNPSSRVTLSDGCIGREQHCEGTSDPVDDGTWDENP